MKSFSSQLPAKLAAAVTGPLPQTPIADVGRLRRFESWLAVAGGADVTPACSAVTVAHNSASRLPSQDTVSADKRDEAVRRYRSPEGTTQIHRLTNEVRASIWSLIAKQGAFPSVKTVWADSFTRSRTEGNPYRSTISGDKHKVLAVASELPRADCLSGVVQQVAEAGKFAVDQSACKWVALVSDCPPSRKCWLAVSEHGPSRQSAWALARPAAFLDTIPPGM